MSAPLVKAPSLPRIASVTPAHQQQHIAAAAATGSASPPHVVVPRALSLMRGAPSAAMPPAVGATSPGPVRALPLSMAPLTVRPPTMPSAPNVAAGTQPSPRQQRPASPRRLESLAAGSSAPAANGAAVKPPLTVKPPAVGLGPAPPAASSGPEDARAAKIRDLTERNQAKMASNRRASAPASSATPAQREAAAAKIQVTWRHYLEERDERFARRQARVEKASRRADEIWASQRAARAHLRELRSLLMVQRRVRQRMARHEAEFRRRKKLFQEQLAARERERVMVALDPPPRWLKAADVQEADAEARAQASASGCEVESDEVDGVYRSFDVKHNPKLLPAGYVAKPSVPKGDDLSAPGVVKNAIDLLTNGKYTEAVKFLSGYMSTAAPPAAPDAAAASATAGSAAAASSSAAVVPAAAASKHHKPDDVRYLFHLARALFSGQYREELDALRGLAHPGKAHPAVALYVLSRLQFAVAGTKIDGLELALRYANDFMRAAAPKVQAGVPAGWKALLETKVSDVRAERRKALAPPGPSEAELAGQEWAVAKKSHGAASVALDQLFAMTGLAAVKKQMLTIFDSASVFKQRREAINKQRFHCCYTGNPGTGKTTVARIYSALLIELGALPASAKTLEITGSDLANGGANALQKILGGFKNDGGGVLFIDEAYQLQPDSNPGGRDVVNLLLTEMENKIGELVVIFAGYSKPIADLLAFNVGFPSRIAYTFKFEDYSQAELLTITVNKLKATNAGREKNQLPLFEYERGVAGPWIQVLVRRLARASGRQGFGNARSVGNMIDQMRQRQVARLAKLKRAKAVGAEDDDDAAVSAAKPAAASAAASKDAKDAAAAHSAAELKRALCFTQDDILGPRPSAHLLDSCPAWATLNGMTGLASVKAKVLALVEGLQVNYDLELQNRNIRPVSLNQVFLGNPGTGKTTVAKLYGAILKHMSFLSKGEVHEKTSSSFIGSALGQSEQKTMAILSESEGGILLIDEAYDLNPAGGGSGQQGGGLGGGGDPYRTAVINTLVANVHNQPGDDRCVILMGYTKEMEELMDNVNPGFRRRFGASSIEFQDFTADELTTILRSSLAAKSLHADADAVLASVDELEKLKLRPNFGNAGAVNNLVSNAMIAQQTRVKAIKDDKERQRERDLNRLTVEDFRGTTAKPKDVEEIFKQIVGSRGVIEQVRKLQRTIQLAKRMGKADPFEDIPRNYLFVGPPGTGKTTVARIMGELFHSIGVLGSSEVVELSASKFTTGYVGQASLQTLKNLRTGLGKVLFIDEAYRLNPKRGASFNGEVLDELTNALTSTEFKGKMVTILAGYEAEVEDLLEANPGLPSRFPVRYRFTPFSAAESFQVLDYQLGLKGIRLVDGEVSKKLMPEMEELIESASWGNGRDLETLAALCKERVVEAELRRADKAEAAGQSVGVPVGANGDLKLPVSENMLRRAIEQMLGDKARRAELLKAKAERDARERGQQPPTQSQDGGGQQARKPVTTTSTEVKKAGDGGDPDDEEGGAKPKAPQSPGKERGVSKEHWDALQLAKARYERKRAQMNASEKKNEEKVQELLKKHGQCEMGFEWIETSPGNYVCGGGSHTMSLDDLQQYE